MQINGKEIRKITVLGLGLSGCAALRLAAIKGFSAVGIDENVHCDMLKLTSGLSDSAKIITGFNKTDLPASDLIVISPGIADSSPLGKLALSSEIPVLSELDFASRFAEVPMVAVTGTNGKTTVTEMTEMILGNAVASGNIGYSLSKAVLDINIGSLVVEASSFQLEKSPGFAPAAAAILNCSSDHMDRYADFADYVSAKFNIFRNIPDASNMIINYNIFDEWERRRGEFISLTSDSAPLTFSATSDKALISLKNGLVDFGNSALEPVDLSSSHISGKHNIENFMASVALAASLLSIEALQKGIKRLLHDFRISAHRQEVIAEKTGVKYVNDSKATNPDALAAALEVFCNNRNIILIAGGLDKKMDFSNVLRYRENIKTAFLIGESKNILKNVWGDSIHCEICDSFKEAVRKSMDSNSSGDVVLLSPGCASMDMFTNYKERGEKFREIILQSLA